MYVTMTKEPVSEMHFKKNYYIRYKGVMMACYEYEIIQKPMFNVVYKVKYMAGLWVLENSVGKSVMNSFELKNIMTYAYKMLK